MITITDEYLASQGLSGTFPQRFWSKVKKSDGCWIWTGTVDVCGYGTIRRGKKNWPHIRASRASFILTTGTIPDGLCVLHHCDTPLCVRPSHLWLGTQRDNMADMNAKGRHGNNGPAISGANGPMAKLTQEQVERIRLLRASGKKLCEIAPDFHVSMAQISRICLYQTWIKI